MKKTGKILALVLSFALVMSLAACGAPAAKPTTAPTKAPEVAATAKPSEEPKKEDLGTIALVTDVGTIDDESFNQGTWEGIKAYADKNGIECNYYQPTADTTDARMTSIDQAVKEGAGVIVVPGFLFGEAMLTAPDQYPDVKFIASDVNPATDMGGATPAKNLYCLCFAEEQCGFLAGYAAVKDGYKDLGFLGGMAVPAVVRFGQGYVQGASAAAEELGVDVNVKYMYGGQFFGDANITAKMEGWYQNGTELVFACGGGIWTSPAEAAVKHNGMIIGVDTDQHHLGENKETYAYNPFITSAVKALSASTEYALDLAYSGKFDTIGGTFDILGLQQGDFVGLATADASWGFKNYTVADNDKVIADIKSGKIKIDNNCDAAIHVETGAHTTVTYIE